MVRHRETWALDLFATGLSHSGYFRIYLFSGSQELRSTHDTIFHPPLQWTSFPPLVAAVLIEPKGVE